MTSSPLKTTTDATFDAALAGAGRPVLLCFSAAWCGPCRRLTPVLEQIASEGADVEILKADVDTCPELAARHGIRSIPCLVLYKDGAIAATRMGTATQGELLRWLQG